MRVRFLPISPSAESYPTPVRRGCCIQQVARPKRDICCVVIVTLTHHKLRQPQNMGNEPAPKILDTVAWSLGGIFEGHVIRLAPGKLLYLMEKL